MYINSWKSQQISSSLGSVKWSRMIGSVSCQGFLVTRVEVYLQTIISKTTQEIDIKKGKCINSTFYRLPLHANPMTMKPKCATLETRMSSFLITEDVPWSEWTWLVYPEFTSDETTQDLFQNAMPVESDKLFISMSNIPYMMDYSCILFSGCCQYLRVLVFGISNHKTTAMMTKSEANSYKMSWDWLKVWFFQEVSYFVCLTQDYEG